MYKTYANKRCLKKIPKYQMNKQEAIPSPNAKLRIY